MKILMFTPTVKNSAIGRMACLLVGELQQQGHLVLVVRAESTALFEMETHDFGMRLIRWDQPAEIVAYAQQTDTIVYQVGDSFEMHQGCIEWLPKLPGVVCLHDYFLGHLFWSWSNQHGRESAHKVLKAFYGSAVYDNYFNVNSSEAFIESTRLAAPMTEWIASMASGIVTHSDWDVARLITSCGGPIEIAPLPYDVPSQLTAVAKPASNTHEAKAVLNILTIGHVNPNKRVESVIRAIGSDVQLCAQVRYRIVGKVEDEMKAHLTNVAIEVGVQIKFDGEVDQETLARAIGDADMMCCLRIPALEAASASTIEAMLMGKPALVVNTGFYKDLPDHCVVKVSIENEITDIRDALVWLVGDVDARVEMGKQAALFAHETFSVKHYATRLTAVCKQAALAAPALNGAKFFGQTLTKWGGVSDNAVLNHIVTPWQKFVGAN